jgi:molecular chaperone DnaK|uniref:Chaperone protein dnaK n=2 Tax=Phaeodactylum tricornutum TaxID=2850 RepID=DNAK_PHATC|nr:heat shock protein 70 [Phaeodactylum tricornutum]A0T0H7.1 RecName: Full=Chaperone protein dnaK; AltName: Full=HSP70; AltName: Full=Heat shock 70 kDa protein; AltName: Full=Heat shock protein 70 [Phaeodactylum tricornutum CCAP 1055/1]ABK20675.1 Hsp70-type chaperone [Phaeodactylum tricornutum]QHR85629.1 Hsp70-type chaperone [Phaeodactylum tricornutum]
MGKVVGIDLGTTNSVVAAIEGGQPSVIINAEGLRTTPSIVAYTKKEELLVGQIAKRQAVINPENTFFSVKRFIGSKEGEISKEAKKLPYKVSNDQNNNIKIKCPALNRDFSPEEISAQVLRKLINDATDYLGQEVTQAVITVPAYFNDSQRQATMDAGKIAGVEVLRIINEPTAASLAYGLDKKQNETILVFDLGGGTFDVSILEVGDGIFEVLSTAGDTNLGGDDFDNVLVNWLINDFKEKNNIDLGNDVQALQRLTEAAEKAKVELSTVEKTTIHLPFITADKTGPKHIEQELTRDVFENLCQALINRCRIPVEKSLNDARLDKADINEIVLVGGSTRIPAVQNLVESLTGKKPNQSVNPDEVVAIGAAIQAGILAGEIKDILLLDVTPLSLGVETLGGVMTKIIARNTTIPVKKSEMFSTAVDNQTNVEIHILQGERELVAGNKSLGNFRLDGIPAADRGAPQIEVTFDIDVDGILSVKAREKETGVEQAVTIQGASNLNEKEVEEMLVEAEKFASADKVKRENIDVKNQAEALCFEAEKEVSSFNDTVPENKKQNIKTLIENIRQAVQTDNFETLKEQMEELKTAMKDIVALKSTNDTATDPMSNLNDL